MATPPTGSTLEGRRGDIVIVELDTTRSSEQHGTRPCLVVQNDVGNENAPTTNIVPFTTYFGDDRYPFEVLVPESECALAEDSVAICSQLRTVSVDERITETLGPIPDDRLAAVDTALEYSLGLTAM